jgi:hypothetical protein
MNNLLSNIMDYKIMSKTYIYIFKIHFYFHMGNDDKISIHEYLNFHMSSLFSFFTIYKPSLLIMYDF